MEEIQKLKRAVIKEEYVAITGDFIKAVILNQFIYWSERVKDFDVYIEQENARATMHGMATQDLTGGWIYKTSEELSSETMLGLSVASIRNHIKALEKMGFLSERNNPKYKWDKTKQYRVNLCEVLEKLHENGYTLDGYKTDIRVLNNNTPFLNSKNGDKETKNQTERNLTAIPEITTKTTSNITTKKSSAFAPPTVEEVKEYCIERKNNVDAEKFVDYYTSKGWLVGKTKMKDWKAAVRNWERNNFNNSKPNKQSTAEQQKKVEDNTPKSKEELEWEKALGLHD